MSTSAALQELSEVRDPLPSKPLNEAGWQAWLERGRARDRRNNAARMVAVKWASLAALAAIATLWSRLGPYDVAARFFVAGGAVAVMLHSTHAGRYISALVFAVVALVYNPVVPVFGFYGDWPRALVLASALPFVASLTAQIWRKERNA